MPRDLPPCFKAYDVRGRVGHELDERVAARIGRAAAEVTGADRVVIGRDPRPSSADLAAALAAGLTDAGAAVADLGLCGTEEVYFAAGHLGAAGIMVTASHNPAEYNGMKLVGVGAAPLDADAFAAIGHVVAGDARGVPTGVPAPEPVEMRATYAAHVAGFATGPLGPLHLLADAGHGAAGPTFDAVLGALGERAEGLTVTRLHHAPDGTFPAGIPNPLLPENRRATAEAVRTSGAGMGVAWDGDFDRCFLFDEGGAFVDGEYVVALLAEAVLAAEPGAAIVHDPRVVWATQDAIRAGGGRAVVSRTGHAHLKAAMRAEGAAYGGEMSAHHYFRDFFACDSGMIPWILVARRLAETGRTLGALVAERRARFPSSGEINFRVPDPQAVMTAVEERWGGDARAVERMDGLTLVFADWRMNLRASSTEPLLRLNAEAKGNADLLAARVGEVRALIEAA